MIKSKLKSKAKAKTNKKIVAKKNKKPAKKIAAKKIIFKKKPTPKKGKKTELWQEKFNVLLKKGKERGFITETEILTSFPQIESDVSFLEQIYDMCEKADVEVITSKDLIELPSEGEISEEDLKKATRVEDLGEISDAVQNYLREIGKIPLLNAARERELAKRVQEGDKEARQILIQSNLRLVVSIAKKYVNRSPNLTL